MVQSSHRHARGCVYELQAHPIFWAESEEWAVVRAMSAYIGFQSITPEMCRVIHNLPAENEPGDVEEDQEPVANPRAASMGSHPSELVD